MKDKTIVGCFTLCMYVLGTIEKVFGLINKICPISSKLWLVLFVLGLVSSIIFFFWDKIMGFFIPDISWRNDGFAYMTIEARFRDNFNKTGYEFSNSKSNDHYSSFCMEKVMNASDIVKLHPKVNGNNDAEKYRAKLKSLMQKYNVSVNDDIQYLFANTPFLFAEHYYFYHILKLYKGGDPWVKVKEESLNKSKKSNRISQCINPQKQLNELINQSVFANSTDLSQTNAKVKNAESNSDGHISEYIINNLDEIQSYIADCFNANKTVHIIVDNSGIELISDLILGKYLIDEYKVNVEYHCNVLPIFVSDAVRKDFDDAIAAIEEIDNNIGEKIKEYINLGKITITPDVFWNMPFPFKEMPKELSDKLNAENVGLIIIKGDLNYRRLVEDKKWPITMNTARRVKYLKRPKLILRTLKSNTLLGVDRNTRDEFDKKRPNWKITGDFGMIQFIK